MTTEMGCPPKARSKLLRPGCSFTTEYPMRSIADAEVTPRAKAPMRARGRRSGISTRCLTVKLRGRAEAPDWSRGCTISLSTRGDTTVHHGPLQRLLGADTESTRPTTL